MPEQQDDPIAGLQECSAQQATLAAEVKRVGDRKKALLAQIPGMEALLSDFLRPAMDVGYHRVVPFKVDDDGNIVVNCLKEAPQVRARLGGAGVAILREENGQHVTRIVVDPGQEGFFDKVKAAIAPGQPVKTHEAASDAARGSAEAQSITR